MELFSPASQGRSLPSPPNAKTYLCLCSVLRLSFGVIEFFFTVRKGKSKCRENVAEVRGAAASAQLP